MNSEDNISVVNNPLELNVTNVNYTKIINDTYIPNVHNSIIFQNDEQGGSLLLVNNDNKVSLGFPYINNEYICDEENTPVNIKNNVLTQLESVLFVDNEHSKYLDNNAYDYIKSNLEKKYNNTTYVDSYHSITKRMPLSSYTTLKVDDNVFDEILNKTKLQVSGIDNKINKLKTQSNVYNYDYNIVKEKTKILADYKHNNKYYNEINNKLNDNNDNNIISFKERIYKLNDIYYHFLYNKNPDIEYIKQYRPVHMLNSDLYNKYTNTTANKEEIENKYNNFVETLDVTGLNRSINLIQNDYNEYNTELSSLTGLIQKSSFPENVFETNITNDDLLNLPRETIADYITNKLKDDLNTIIDNIEKNTSYKVDKYTNNDITSLIYDTLEEYPNSYNGFRYIYNNEN